MPVHISKMKYRYSRRFNSLAFTTNPNASFHAIDADHCKNIYLSNNNCKLVFDFPHEIVTVHGVISGQFYHSE